VILLVLLLLPFLGLPKLLFFLPMTMTVSIVRLSPLSWGHGQAEVIRLGGLCHARLSFTYPLLLGCLILLAKLSQPIIFFLLEIRLLLHLRLVEPIDDGILPLWDQDTLHLRMASEVRARCTGCLDGVLN
jgi:hypothetical protein